MLALLAVGILLPCFVCFTGPVGFVSWKTLLGEEWLRNASEQQLDSAVRGIWFDGRWYWRETNAGVWRRYSREDTKLHLQQQGYSDKTEKGATISDVGRLLLLIQSTQVVDAVVPLVNYRPGYCQIAGKAYVNSMRIRALEPSTGGEWPWLSRFLDGFFANPEELAYNRHGLPRRALYRVRFDQKRVWPDYAGPAGDTIDVEIYEHWLEKA